jgi:hypothetical protein
MSLKLYLWGLKIWTLVSFVAVSAVVYFYDPNQGGVNLIFFYSSVFLFLGGMFTLLLTLSRKKYTEDDEVLLINVGMSFRQGMLLALLGVILLGMQSFRVLVWWDGLLVLAGILLVELFFLTR